MKNKNAALVVGLCAHGLSVVRALAKQGVQVFAVEANKELPGVHTRYANVLMVKDINSEMLIEELIKIAIKLDTYTMVLFLTNDNMVINVAKSWERLCPHYLASWESCSKKILRLLHKDSFADYCLKNGFKHPKTILLKSVADLKSMETGLKYPVIIKPTKPLSGFKVKLIYTRNTAEKLFDLYAKDLPFIAQEWIAGSDECIYSSTLYLIKGRVVDRFESRKIRSFPPTLGAASATIQIKHEIFFNKTVQFFMPMDLSGPVALEYKIDDKGIPWIIEANLARTEYTLDMCIKAGVNIPYHEYCEQTGHSYRSNAARLSILWVDSERDKCALISALFHILKNGPCILSLSFFDISDIKPFLYATKKLIFQLKTSLIKKISSFL